MSRYRIGFFLLLIFHFLGVPDHDVPYTYFFLFFAGVAGGGG